MGVIYRHPSTDLTDFNCKYLNKLLENISKEQKSILLLGDFKVKLLNYNEHNQINEFLDSLASNSIVGNRATQDTSQRSQGKFFLSFLYTLFYIF